MTRCAGRWFEMNRRCISRKAHSSFSVYRLVSKSGVDSRLAFNLDFNAPRAFEFCPSRTAIDSYSCTDFAISSGIPIAVNRLAATRPAKVCPGSVNTGNPAQSASLAVVCALQGSVSRNRSASRCLARWSSRSTLGANTRRSGLKPR